MKLSVVIVNYNVKYFLEQCLQSVRVAMQSIEGEVFVVDNNSVDGSCAMMHKKFQRQKIELIQDRKCLERAKTFAQAKQCERGENRGEDTISVWNATEKKKILGLIDEGIEAMDCAMHAKSMAVIEQCFPNEK